VECKALKSAIEIEICEALEDLIVSRWGAPRFIKTNNSTKFVNRTIKAYYAYYIIPYH